MTVAKTLAYHDTAIILAEKVLMYWLQEIENSVKVDYIFQNLLKLLVNLSYAKVVPYSTTCL